MIYIIILLTLLIVAIAATYLARTIDNPALLVLLGFLCLFLAIGLIIYNAVILFPQTQPEATNFCESLGLEYYTHFTWDFKIMQVTCISVIQSCPANNCTLIDKKIKFSNYPERNGEVVCS